MDIVDIILAKKLTPQGQIETYARTSQKAVANANAAVAVVEAAAEDIEEKQSAAQDLLEQAQEALETAREAQIAMPEVYDTTGQNTDGYMTQKAVTDALDTKATIVYVNNGLSNKVDNSTLNNYATTAYVTQQIASIPSSGMPSGVSNLGIDNAGKIVVIGPDGNIMSGDITEEAIIEALVHSEEYTAEGTTGLVIDYSNKSFSRSQESSEQTSGNFFNKYSMYGGRMRCNVADDGTINAFYGDPTYTEDGSNGQVMIYQPKFYYMRTPVKTANNLIGKIIRKESIILSDKDMAGFKLHPIFKDANGNELDYVLLSTYEANLQENKLTSIAGVKPVSNINILDAETYASNRGEGWHMTNLAAESVNQMLEIVEYGTMNIQSEIEQGIINITTDTSSNHASDTGSTSSIGNGTGVATSTVNNGTSYNTVGKRAVCYRGMENPWGNIWHMIGGVLISGNGSNTGSGIPYICNDYNYSATLSNNYTSVGFNLPGVYGWISGMGYGNPDYDWVFLPAECNSTANSATPVGDALWAEQSLMGIRCAVIGGSWSFKEQSGAFAYGCDRSIAESSRATYGTRIMFIPTKNSIYNNNITKWRQHYGG